MKGFALGLVLKQRHNGQGLLIGCRIAFSYFGEINCLFKNNFRFQK